MRELEILEASGTRFLVTQANGAETTGLKQAANIYRNICNRAGLQSHATRYAFSEERIQAYRNEGYSMREARVATSLDLGHGDGEGVTLPAFMSAVVRLTFGYLKTAKPEYGTAVQLPKHGQLHWCVLSRTCHGLPCG